MLLILGVVYFASYFPGSIGILAIAGVEERRVTRAANFGCMIAALQIAPPALLAMMMGDIGFVLGTTVSLVGSYFYVASVLNITWYKNIGIVILLPMLSTIIAGAVYLMIFRLVG
ncbi:hypothetical protein BST95_02930 [Halioglobus japonicus]|uniref:Uncharacterized protein n=1 Tax=Halioglobus japonicus TaxID=930805 RepID=A0AAP8MCG5_9GAMM|nr:hypothetical protein [Halioglobus japonicus]AQA17336.1 hypothetical protein BST95_02930 [Halioglobus japonicus]PLW85257.1 hypothetical protein C0029_11500 [Halioglobus japonicus]GHD24203.1 hypothetical protein GCM10007052_37680 [Halioglobus japonicus]